MGCVGGGGGGGGTNAIAKKHKVSTGIADGVGGGGGVGGRGGSE